MPKIESTETGKMGNFMGFAKLNIRLANTFKENMSMAWEWKEFFGSKMEVNIKVNLVRKTFTVLELLLIQTSERLVAIGIKVFQAKEEGFSTLVEIFTLEN